MILPSVLILRGCPDQGKQRGVERSGPVAVQGHVHGDQPLGEGAWESAQLLVLEGPRLLGTPEVPPRQEDVGVGWGEPQNVCSRHSVVPSLSEDMYAAGRSPSACFGSVLSLGS